MYRMNAEERKEYMKQYLKQYRLKNKKSSTISNWKQHGLIGDLDAIYDRWLNATNCELCNKSFASNKKCMEHNHATGQFRNIVCNSCNTNKSDRKKPTTNTSGYKNIYFHNSGQRWRYHKTFKGKLYTRSSKDKIKILCIKFAYIILHKY